MAFVACFIFLSLVTAISAGNARPQLLQQTQPTVLLYEDFEFGKLGERWTFSGYVAVTDRAPAHSGNYSAILGADYSPPVGLAGDFTLETRLNSIPGAKLTTEFWFKAHNLFDSATAFRGMQLTVSLFSGAEPLWKQRWSEPWDSFETWTPYIQKDAIARTSDIVLRFEGKGGGINLLGVGAILIDDVKVTQVTSGTGTTEVTTRPTAPSSTTPTTTQRTTQPGVVATATPPGPEFTSGTLGLMGLIVAVAIVSSYLVLARRKRVVKPSAALEVRKEPAQPPRAVSLPPQQSSKEMSKLAAAQTEPAAVSQIAHRTPSSHGEYLRRLEELRTAGKVRDEVYQKVREAYLKLDKVQPTAASHLEKAPQVQLTKAVIPLQSKGQVLQEPTLRTRPITTTTEPAKPSETVIMKPPISLKPTAPLPERKDAGTLMKLKAQIQPPTIATEVPKPQEADVKKPPISPKALEPAAQLFERKDAEAVQQPKAQSPPSVEVEVPKPPEADVKKPLPAPKPEQKVSTGYGDLDRLLLGGLPEGYAVVFVSPSCDERDLLLRKIVETGLNSGRTILYMSGDIATTKDLVGSYQKGFYAFSPQADKIASDLPNLQKIPGVQTLTDLNISMAKAIANLRLSKSASKIIVVDLLSDVLLTSRAPTTRRWVGQFAAARKAEGFTILCTINPLIAKEDTQIITDIFDGIIEIYEKEVKDRTRRFIMIKKMHRVKYSDAEVMLDKDKLF